MTIKRTRMTMAGGPYFRYNACKLRSRALSLNSLALSFNSPEIWLIPDDIKFLSFRLILPVLIDASWFHCHASNLIPYHPTPFLNNNLRSRLSPRHNKSSMFLVMMRVTSCRSSFNLVKLCCVRVS